MCLGRLSSLQISLTLINIHLHDYDKFYKVPFQDPKPQYFYICTTALENLMLCCWWRKTTSDLPVETHLYLISHYKASGARPQHIEKCRINSFMEAEGSLHYAKITLTVPLSVRGGTSMAWEACIMNNFIMSNCGKIKACRQGRRKKKEKKTPLHIKGVW